MTLRDDTSDDPHAVQAGVDVDPRRAAPAPVTVVVVDAHAAVREGLPLLLRAEGVEVLATAATGHGGEELVAYHRPDVALVAADLPDVDGIVLVRRLACPGARTAVVLYASDEDAQQASLALHAGAAGVVAKRCAIAALAGALRTVAAGGLWFGEPDEPSPRPRRTAALLADLRTRRTAALSESELRVLALVAAGSSTDAIAEALSLSPHTVRTHLRNVMRKLQASSRAHAVAIAMREAAIEV